MSAGREAGLQLWSSGPEPAAPEVAADTRRSDFERVGGEAGLHAIIREFMSAVFDDPMIGFLFAGKPKARIAELEYRFAAEHLGGGVRYDGRPLGVAHARTPISSGHFERRLRILLDTLARHGVPADVQARWAAHVEARRAEVMGGGPDACGPT